MATTTSMTIYCHLHNFIASLITVRKRMFLHVSVILSTGGGVWYPSMHYKWYPSMPYNRSGGGIPACLAGFQAHTQGEVEGSGLRGLQAHTLGGVSQQALRQTLLTATVADGTHPLLECILVFVEVRLYSLYWYQKKKEVDFG